VLLVNEKQLAEYIEACIDKRADSGKESVRFLVNRACDYKAYCWYSGDLVQKGILMAHRLWHKYPGKIKMWRYSPEVGKKQCLP